MARIPERPQSIQVLKVLGHKREGGTTIHFVLGEYPELGEVVDNGWKGKETMIPVSGEIRFIQLLWVKDNSK